MVLYGLKENLASPRLQPAEMPVIAGLQHPKLKPLPTYVTNYVNFIAHEVVDRHPI